MSQPLFKVSNHHTADSGRAPELDADVEHVYFGYFANEHGEQAIYMYDFTTGEATVRMGDTGWDETHAVADGRIAGIRITKAEAAWVHAWNVLRGAWCRRCEQMRRVRSSRPTHR